MAGYLNCAAPPSLSAGVTQRRCSRLRDNHRRKLNFTNPPAGQQSCRQHHNRLTSNHLSHRVRAASANFYFYFIPSNLTLAGRLQCSDIGGKDKTQHYVLNFLNITHTNNTKIYNNSSRHSLSFSLSLIAKEVRANETARYMNPEAENFKASVRNGHHAH